MKVTDKIEILKGDCLELMKSIPDGSIDSVICDPPYGTTACKWDSVIDFALMWEQLNRIIKPNGAIVLFGSEPFSSALRMSNIKNYKYDWIWDKNTPTGFLNAKRMPLKQHENIIIFYENQCLYNRQMVLKTYNGFRNGDKHDKSLIKEGVYGEKIRKTGNRSNYRNPKTILTFNGGGSIARNYVHPTQKPIALMEYLIRTYTNENETILDFTMGSGSTLVACQNLNRNAIGIEQDEEYFNTAWRRLEQNETQQRMF